MTIYRVYRRTYDDYHECWVDTDNAYYQTREMAEYVANHYEEDEWITSGLVQEIEVQNTCPKFED